MRFKDVRIIKKWLLPGLFAVIVLTIALSGMIATCDAKKEAEDLQVPDSFSIRIDQTIRVYDVDSGEIIKMDLEEYIIHVTAAEMPASYEPEALKAQAVAARTFAVEKKQGSGCASADGADVCTSSGHCQAFDTLEEMQDKWGKDFDTYYEKIKQAVADTKGKIILYDGEPIEVLYHSSSGGITENAENVFLSSRPYLKSVVSEGEEGFSRFYDEKTFSAEEFIAELREFVGKKDIGQDGLEGAVGEVKRFESGRVESIEIFGYLFSGREMRSIFSLNSTNFELAVNADHVVFHTVGFGHGVGMSQAGADAMAKKGAAYEEILKHYYQDIEIGDID